MELYFFWFHCDCRHDYNSSFSLSKVIEFLLFHKGSSKITKLKRTNQTNELNQFFWALMIWLRQHLSLKLKNAFENKVAISNLAVKISYIPNNISNFFGWECPWPHSNTHSAVKRMFLFLGGTLAYLTENLLLPNFCEIEI